MNCPIKTIAQEIEIKFPTSENPKWKFANIPVSMEIKENDTANEENLRIDLFRSCLYPNLANSSESLLTLDRDMT